MDLPDTIPTTILEGLETLQRELAAFELETPSVGYVYNYLNYAQTPFGQYLDKYLPDTRPVEALFLGMNPGPWGTAQTGVPFGDVKIVAQWLGISGEVGQPEKMSSKRPIEGFDLERGEVSGERLWGWIEERWRTPERFFEEHFIWSHCPLMFIHTNGSRNITPDRLLKSDRDVIYPACDRFLKVLIEELRPRWCIGIGRYATDCFERVLPGVEGVDAEVVRILHPSPASPAANRGWAAKIEEQLTEAGFSLP